MTIRGRETAVELTADQAVLATGSDGLFSVTVDKRARFQGGDGRYYLTEAAAQSAPGGSAREVTFAIPEFVSDVTRTFPGESGYADHERMFAELSKLEGTLAGRLSGEAGSEPGVPLGEVLRGEAGFELTALGRRTVIGPQAVGDWPGSHVQHTFGVPLTGLYVFLEHVRDHTWRDGSGVTRPARTWKTGWHSAARSLPRSLWKSTSGTVVFRLAFRRQMNWRGAAHPSLPWRRCADTLPCCTPARRQ